MIPPRRPIQTLLKDADTQANDTLEQDLGALKRTPNQTIPKEREKAYSNTSLPAVWLASQTALLRANWLQMGTRHRTWTYLLTGRESTISDSRQGGKD